MDEAGRPLYGFPIAARRNYPGIPWFWLSMEWRGTYDIRWWYEDVDHELDEFFFDV